MDQKVADVRTAQWREIVRDCSQRTPGQTKKDWCLQNGIRFRSLMYWQRKFQVEALALMEKCSPNYASMSSSQPPVPAFADMTARLHEASQDISASAAESEAPALTPEVMIQHGAYRIYVNSSIHEATLETVIKVLSRA